MNSDDADDQSLPPVAQFADGSLAPPPPRTIPVAMQEILEAIEGFDGFAAAEYRRIAARKLCLVAGAEAEYLAAQMGSRRAETATRSATQAYFRIRTASLSGDEALWHCLRVVSGGSRPESGVKGTGVVPASW